MKKTVKKIILLFCITLTLSFMGCADIVKDVLDNQNNKNNAEENFYTVTFNYNNGEEDETILIKSGNKVTAPEEPKKKNYFFAGWYTDKNFAYKYDFSRIVNGDLELFAKYERFFSVTFNYNNGNPNKTISVKSGDSLSMPEDPKKTNYLFVGWYTDKNFTYKYDFSRIVNDDLNLFAKYEIDAASITNIITKNTMKGIFKIYNKCYNSFLGTETSYLTRQGSGFCFHIQNGYCYILTNSHVAYKDSSYDKQKFTIEDYRGNEYTGYLYQNPNKSFSAISSSYDLACLYFKLDSTEVQELSLAMENPEINEDVISLGAPESQTNAITYGCILGYTKNNMVSAGSNVTFDIIYHDAYINNGSSGGPLLNAELIVIGVNYAASAEGERGAAIPAEKVYEFLKKYVYN